MAKIKKFISIIDDYPSTIGPKAQTDGIETFLANASPNKMDTVMLKFDDITDLNQLFKTLLDRDATHLICFRIVTLRSLISTFWELCQFISDLKKQKIEFVSVNEGLNTEDEFGVFLKNLTQGWQSARSMYKSENAKISQMKAREKGTALGRPKKRDDLKIIALRQQGLSIRDIAVKTGVSTAAVQRSLKTIKLHDLD